MLDTVFLGNTVKEWAFAAATYLVVLIAFLWGRKLLVSRMRWLADKTETTLDDLVVDLLEMVRNPECHLLAFYFASRPLTLPHWLDKSFHAAVIVAVTYRVATMLQRVARYAVAEGLLKGHAQDQAYLHTTRTLAYVVDFVVWAGALLFALSNLGFNVSSMLAGLGIGGIAVALAAQAVLGDLFAAIALYLDRPFVIGQTITFGDSTGTVEQIGFKTTRIRSVNGELLIVPNSQLASAKIQNWAHMSERRAVLTFSAACGTPPAKLAALPGKIREVIQAAGGEGVTIDRVHLARLGASSVDFEAVYMAKTPEYGVHMDIQQRVLLGVLELFEREGVEIPYPTQTVRLEKTA